MAALLGGQFCMESLQKDVTDLQAAVNDVFSRVGPVRYPSWKYPDKMSCDLDVDELLSLHSYSTDLSDEERQMSHVVLYELVIDRLVLLLQGMSKYMDHLLLQGKCPVGVDPPSNTSVGLVIKKYWKRLVQVHALCTQLNSQCKSKDRKIFKLQDSVHNGTEESISREGGSSSKIGFDGLIPPSSADMHSVLGSPISYDCCHKSSQTLETAFVPCESCFCVQKSLRETGDCVINMCQSQGLPSSLHKFKPHVVENDWLTANEVSQWNSEQMKDLNRINKHLDQLYSTSENLKTDLKETNKKCEKFQERVQIADKEVKMEKDTQRGIAVQFETKISKLENQHSESFSLVQNEKKKLIQTQTQLESQLENYKSELTSQKKLLQELKETQSDLEKELKVTRSETGNAELLQRQVETLTGQLTEVTSQLEVKSSQLAKEQSKSKSVAKHTQSLQNKQGSLLTQLEELGQDNEDLKGQVCDLEDVKDDLEGALRTSKEQLVDLTKRTNEDKILISRLGDEKSDLEKSISETEKCLTELERKLQESREQQKLLVEFPDLNGPVNQNLQTSGDIIQDMENQIEANSLRIKVLEEQNDAFRNSIRKMLQSRDNGRQEPIPLWKSSGLGTLTEDPDSHRAPTVSYKAQWSVPKEDHTTHNIASKQNSSKSSLSEGNESFLIGRSSRPNSASKRHSALTPTRPSSGKSGNKVTSQGNSSVGVYKQLKNSGKLSGGGEAHSYGSENKVASKPSSYLGPITFICELCDKMYSRKKDLDVHKSYCSG